MININFQGRVIPIEETAFDTLKRYIESLRRYFAGEEGRDEIINDIESRIGELFGERLKNGATCITDADVASVIEGMGRPEDFEAQESGEPAGTTAGASAGPSFSSGRQTTGRTSLYRNADDKVLGGVCSGLANYTGIDPVIVRILFVLLFGALVWVYFVLWIVVPSRSIQSNITKRLYRSPDDRMVAGVCGGLAAYFNTKAWIPRLIFALPLILVLLSGGFSMFWWDPFDFGFVPLISGSFGWTLFLAYIILWIAVPVARSSSEKLEMRGERVDVNSIRDTVKEDLESFRTRAEKWGTEVKASAMKWGAEASARTGAFSTEAGQAVRNSSRGLGRAIGLLFKAVLILAFAAVAIFLFGIFIALLGGAAATAPLKDFVITGPVQHILSWAAMFLVLVIPLVAFVTWAIRRMTGNRSRRHYLGYTLAGLWVIGLLAGLVLAFSIVRNFRSGIRLDEQSVRIEQPVDRLMVEVEQTDWKNRSNQFFGMDVEDDWPLYTRGDSLLLNTVRISMVKSSDSLYHVYLVKGSRGSTFGDAAATAEKIAFEPIQHNDVLTLPRGFFIDKKSKFRNQRVWVVFEVPVGKKIAFNRNISWYDWIHIGPDRHSGDWDFDGEERNNNMYSPSPGREYIMNTQGKAERVKETTVAGGLHTQ